MKRKLLTTLTLILFISSALIAQDPANDDYIKAMTENDINKRVQLLKAWINTYGGSGHQYETFANATICIAQYSGKTADEAIKYGEKAISLGGLDDPTKSSVLATVAMMSLQKSDTSKAKKYAGQLIQHANALKSKDSPNGKAQANQLIGAGNFIQAQALQKEKNNKAAVDAYIKSYSILKNKEIATSLAQLGKSLYEAKDYPSAEKAFKVAVPVLNDFGSITLYAKTLHRGGKRNDALKYYKQSYNKRKTGEVAYNIGIILAGQTKSNPSVTNEAIQYLLDASFLSPANSQKAMQTAEGLYFSQNPDYNEKVKQIQAKNKNIEQLTKTFNNKFGEKDEEDLSDAEKKEMDSLLSKIEADQKAVETLQTQQQAAFEKFQALVNQTKQKLGIQ